MGWGNIFTPFTNKTTTDEFRFLYLSLFYSKMVSSPPWWDEARLFVILAQTIHTIFRYILNHYSMYLWWVQVGILQLVEHWLTWLASQYRWCKGMSFPWGTAHTQQRFGCRRTRQKNRFCKQKQDAENKQQHTIKYSTGLQHLQSKSSGIPSKNGGRKHPSMAISDFQFPGSATFFVLWTCCLITHQLLR